MLVPRFRNNRATAAHQRLGLRVRPLVATEQCQIVETLGQLGVLGPPRLFPDRQSALRERLGLRVGALVGVEP